MQAESDALGRNSNSSNKKANTSQSTTGTIGANQLRKPRQFGNQKEQAASSAIAGRRGKDQAKGKATPKGKVCGLVPVL
jgi:hypothetical protein